MLGFAGGFDNKPNVGLDINNDRPFALRDKRIKAVQQMTIRRTIIAAGLVAALASAGCVPSGHLERDQAPKPLFDPVTFFAGRTEGKGSLQIAFRHRQDTLVEGLGRTDGDDGIVLDQDVRREGKPPQHRTWRLHRIGPRHYAGTLTDASGPVTGDVVGNRLHLSFPMKGGLKADQYLYLQPSGQIARNRMVVTKLGIAVASLDEIITRSPGSGDRAP